jgi:hypothetical protein
VTKHDDALSFNPQAPESLVTFAAMVIGAALEPIGSKFETRAVSIYFIAIHK